MAGDREHPMQEGMMRLLRVLVDLLPVLVVLVGWAIVVVWIGRAL